VNPLYCRRDGAARQGCVPAREEECRPPGLRGCLLKGCPCWFEPKRPQCRYCSVDCRKKACRWRRWRAAQVYRRTEQGKACRQAQCQRNRARRRAQAQVMAESGRETSPSSCEGQRAARIPENSEICTCDRPGCYELFVARPHSPPQRFCSPACRQALRRVEQREQRLRARRRRGIGPRRRTGRGPP
jgi:hypothetical protein